MSSNTSDPAQRGDLVKLIDDGITNNFGDWYSRCYHAIRTLGLWKYIEGPESDPPTIPPLREPTMMKGKDSEGVIRDFEVEGNHEEHEKAIKDAQPWFEGNDLLLSKIVAATPELQMHMVEHEIYAKEAWDKLLKFYRPQNSLRATSIKGNIASYRCTPDMDIIHWLADMQHMYADMCRVDRHRMSDYEFSNAILDNLPLTDAWEVTVINLREKLLAVEGDNIASAGVLTQILAKIRDTYWHRNRRNPQVTEQIFSARAEANKRSQKRSYQPDSSSANPSKRARNDKVCTNPHCGSQRGHSFDECLAYGGGSQGKYPGRWRGPWNIHLPPQQRTKANNVPPPSHPRSTQNTATTQAANCVYYAPLPIAAPPAYVSSSPAASTHTRAITSPTPSTSDDKVSINAVTMNESPNYAWNTMLDDEFIVATLPVFGDDVPRSDVCHHDSGATRHVFHDKSAFTTYQPIEPTAVKAFGRKLAAAAIGRGTVRVRGRYGDRVSTILLKDVLHIPAARSNLISGGQLDKAGVAVLSGDGLITLSVKGVPIVGGALYDNMYKLNITIVRPTVSPPLSSRLTSATLVSRIGPIAAAASSDQRGFYTA